MCIAWLLMSQVWGGGQWSHGTSVRAGLLELRTLSCIVPSF